MITQPSTAQIVLSVRRDLLEVVERELESEAAKVSLQMIENVLRNVAERCEHELAWMQEEAAAIEAVAVRCLDVLPESTDLGTALAAYRKGRTGELHYAQAQADYNLAGEVLSCAVEAAVKSGDPELLEIVRDVLLARQEHEIQIRGEWGFVGR